MYLFYFHNFVLSERYPHKPYINDIIPNNVTVLVNTSVSFNCETLSDLEPFIQWLKVTSPGEGDDRLPNGTVIQVILLYEMKTELFGDGIYL